jgi:hypothetical protein
LIYVKKTFTLYALKVEIFKTIYDRTDYIFGRD